MAKIVFAFGSSHGPTIEPVRKIGMTSSHAT